LETIKGFKTTLKSKMTLEKKYRKIT